MGRGRRVPDRPCDRRETDDPPPRARRSALLLALAAPAWLHAAPASAAPTAATSPTIAEPLSAASSTAPPLADRCTAAHALSGLTQAEQHRLVDVCRRNAPPPADLAPLLARVVARGEWEATALADLLAGGAPHRDLGPAAAVAGLRAVHDALRRDRLAACKPLHKALDAYFTARDAGDLPTPPFTADTIGGCLGLAADDLAGLAFLTIPADDPAATAFVAAAAGERVVLQWLVDADAVVHRGRRVFVVAVPRWSVVAVRLVAPSAPAPQQWHGFVTYHQTLWDSPPAASCLRMSVDLDADTTLLLDGEVLTRGRPIAHRTVGVYPGAHTLVAVRCAGDTCAVRFRETLPAVTTTGDNLCQDVALDLHQRRSVALLQARAAPGCDAALAWRAGELATDHLRRNQQALGRTFRDLASFASITQALGALRDGLNPGAGQAVGAATGSDSLDLVASVAKEAWRQGIDELVTLELRCTGTGAAAGYTLQATAISVREAFDRPLGPVAGLDLKNLMRVQSLAFTGEPQLPSTVASLVDHLFDLDYVRFREGKIRFHYRRPARLALVARGGTPGAAWSVDAFHAPDPNDPTRCGTIGPDAAARQLPIEVEQRDDSGQDRELTVSLRARRPGPYLVQAGWARPGAPQDRVCVHFDVPAGELFATAIGVPDITLRTPLPELAARHFRVLVGHTWYLPRRPWLGLGIVGGWTYTRYASEYGIPSWQDLTVDPAVSHAPLTWARHGVVLGPLLEFRSRSARIPLEFRGRLSAGVGFAIVDVRHLTGFVEFAGSSRFGTSDLRLRPTLDVTAELGIGGTVGPLAITPLLALGAVALNDMTRSKYAVSATGGAGLYIGFGFLLGGAP